MPDSVVEVVRCGGGGVGAEGLRSGRPSSGRSVGRSPRPQHDLGPVRLQVPAARPAAVGVPAQEPVAGRAGRWAWWEGVPAWRSPPSTGTAADADVDVVAVGVVGEEPRARL